MTLPTYQLYEPRHSSEDKKTSLARLRMQFDSIMNTLELDDYVGEQLNVLLDGKYHNQIDRVDLRRWVTSELRAGRYIPDPAPCDIHIWVAGVALMVITYALSTLYIIFKPFKWLDRTDRFDWGEGLGMSAVVAIVFFLLTYVIQRGVSDFTYCWRHRHEDSENEERLFTNFLKQLCLHLALGWVASFPAAAVAPVFRGA